jgi:hypothetical protein
MLPGNRIEYGGYLTMVEPAFDAIRALHSLDPSDSNYIELDIDGYLNSGGKIAVIGAGGLIGGAAEAVGGRYFAMAEKEYAINEDQGSILMSIHGNSHEFGHLIGFWHYQGAAYELMHWGGLYPTYHNCPPHINPWAKILAGWIPEDRVVRVRTSTTQPVSIPPSTDSASVAVVTVFGDAGRDASWMSHSEYFIVEYRERAGFNRFTGGKLVDTSFTGGGLVWHYSSLSIFPLGIWNSDAVTNFGLKMRGYPYNARHNPGDPTHLYPYHTQVYDEELDATSNPNSSSVGNMTTGISLHDFSVSNHRLSFSVNYHSGEPPSYNYFIHGGMPNPPQVPISGRVYIQGSQFPLEILPGTIVDAVWSVGGVIDALGTVLSPILFDGPGYGLERFHGYEISPYGGSRLEYCQIRNASTGVRIFDPVKVRLCSFIDCDTDIHVSGGMRNSPATELSGLDSNSFSTLYIENKVKITEADFTLSAGTTTTFGPAGPATITTIEIGNHNLNFFGQLDLLADLKFVGNTFKFFTDLEIPSDVALTFGANTAIELYGSVELDDGFILDLPVGSQVSAFPGASFRIGNNGIISTKGTFHAIGSEEQPITFELKQGSSGSWQGIEVVSATSGALADLKLEYVTMTNVVKAVHVETPAAVDINYLNVTLPYIGIEIVPRVTEEEEASLPVAPGLFIRSTTIAQAHNAIIVDGYSNLLIEGCALTGGNPCCDGMQHGILLNNASPTIRSSCISQFNYGIRGIAQSSPILQNGYFGGYNVITGNMIGVSFEGYSDAILGTQDGEGGQNTIAESDVYNAEVLDNSTVIAQYCYWGAHDPNEQLFSVDGSSKLEFNPWLSDPPGGGCAGQGMFASAGPSAKGGSNGDGDDPKLDPISSKVRIAIQKRLTRDYTAALVALKNIVADSREADVNRRWAIQQLLAVYQAMNSGTLSNYITGLQSTLTQFRRPLSTMLPAAYLHERSGRKALMAYNANITAYPNTSVEAQALYGKFIHALYGRRDRESAEGLLGTLQARFAQSAQTELARAQLAAGSLMNRPKRISGNSGILSSASSNLPTELMMHQNYPNPFNPLTTIKYDLPIDAHVTLKLYDVLGRDVLTLVDGQSRTGYHHTTLDASKLSSGVYFYRIQAGQFSQTKKLILLR